jgi:hypothetical protein
MQHSISDLYVCIRTCMSFSEIEEPTTLQNSKTKSLLFCQFDTAAIVSAVSPRLWYSNHYIITIYYWVSYIQILEAYLPPPTDILKTPQNIFSYLTPCMPWCATRHYNNSVHLRISTILHTWHLNNSLICM